MAILAFKLLHILSMFAAVTFVVSESVFMATAIWPGDVRTVGAVHHLTGNRPTIVGALIFVIGIVFGLLTVATGGLDFFEGWLITAYVLVVVLLAIQRLPVIQKGFRGLLDMTAEAEAGQRPVEEVSAAMAALRGPFLAVVIVNIVIFTALVVDMVVKPF